MSQHRVFQFLIFGSVLLSPAYASLPDELREAESMLLSNSKDDRKSGLNRLEILSLDEETSAPEVLGLIANFMSTAQPEAAEKFKALEIAKNIDPEKEFENQHLRETIYLNFLRSFLDQGRYSLFDNKIYEQFSQAISDQPKVALKLVQEPGTERIGTFTLRALGSVATQEIFSDLDQVIALQSRAEDQQRLRDEARLAKFSILNRELQLAVAKEDRPQIKNLIHQSIVLLSSTQFETKKYDYGKSCQSKARKLVLEYLYWEMRIKNKNEILAENLSDFEDLLEMAINEREDLLDFRLPGILGSIGGERSLSLLEKAKGRGDKTFREFVVGMEVRDGTGKKKLSGGAIGRIQERLQTP